MQTNRSSGTELLDEPTRIVYHNKTKLLTPGGGVSAVIQPKANDTSWVVVPNLWGGIIAPPGFMKSPVITAMTRPLVQIQTTWRKEHEEAVLDFSREKEDYELRLSAWKERFKSSAKSGKAAPDRPNDPPQQPKSRRLIVNDATFEAMHQTMSENPAGIFVIRDELTGWWSTRTVPAARVNERSAFRRGTATRATLSTGSGAERSMWRRAACLCWVAYNRACSALT